MSEKVKSHEKPTKTTRTLQGKRILVTRTREQASVLSEHLKALGAIPIEFPTIHIVPPLAWEPLDNALKQLRTSYYTWLVFTSANGVNTCFDRLHTMGYNAQAISHVRIAAIGPATAAALAHHGITATLVPTEYIAEQVAAALIEDVHQRGESLQGKHILVARAAEARKVLITALQEAGAIVDDIPAYRTVTVANDNEQGREVLHLLQTHQCDILTFTSSSTVRNFMQWLVGAMRVTSVVAKNPEELLDPCSPSNALAIVTANPQLKIASIGPITSQTARELGLNVHIEASKFTIDGLIEAIVQHEGSISLHHPHKEAV